MPDASGLVSLDLTTLARTYRSGSASPADVVERLRSRLDQYPDSAVWIHLLSHKLVLAQARDVEKRHAAGETLPLFGVPFAVKDNIDAAGHPTTAGCPAFAYTPGRSAPVVARLVQAGALLIGKTNMDQFASGLAGDRTPFGACRNVFDSDYVSGGSSSGSAVAVAAGLVSFALGTDTAGSGRVPAGCNNIVGLKPSLGLLTNEGVVPACPSLDCVSIMALTASDAARVSAIATGDFSDPCLTEPASAEEVLGRDWTFGVPRDEHLEFFEDRQQEDLYRQAMGQLEAMGGRRVEVDFRPFREVASLLYEGPWLAERLAALSSFLKAHPNDIHPVTRAVLQGGSRLSAGDVFAGLVRLEALRAVCGRLFEAVDLLVVPTLPTVPRLSDVQADSVRWSRRLGYYTNFVNLLRWTALALPSGFTPRALPGGITLIGPGGSDRQLCQLGSVWQRRLGLPLGATGASLPAPELRNVGSSPYPTPANHVRVAVAGAHLRGQPLHGDLRRMGARFVRACPTASRYRFLGLLNLNPPRPGLLRDDTRAGAVAVEIYDLPVEGFGRLVASVAPPLAIGTIELADGEAVKGFLCESQAAAAATDITDSGGWIAYRTRGAAAVEAHQERQE